MAQSLMTQNLNCLIIQDLNYSVFPDLATHLTVRIVRIRGHIRNNYQSRMSSLECPDGPGTRPSGYPFSRWAFEPFVSAGKSMTAGSGMSLPASVTRLSSDHRTHTGKDNVLIVSLIMNEERIDQVCRCENGFSPLPEFRGLRFRLGRWWVHDYFL